MLAGWHPLSHNPRAPATKVVKRRAQGRNSQSEQNGRWLGDANLYKKIYEYLNKTLTSHESLLLESNLARAASTAFCHVTDPTSGPVCHPSVLNKHVWVMTTCIWKTVTKFRRNLSPSFVGTTLKERESEGNMDPPKYLCSYTRLHGVTSRKSIILNISHVMYVGLAYYSPATPRPLGVTLRSCMLDAQLFLQSLLVPHKKHAVLIIKTLSSASEGILQTPKQIANIRSGVWRHLQAW